MQMIAAQGSFWTDVACKSTDCTMISIIIVIMLFLLNEGAERNIRYAWAACSLSGFPCEIFLYFPQLGPGDFPTNPHLQAPKNAARSAQ